MLKARLSSLEVVSNNNKFQNKNLGCVNLKLLSIGVPRDQINKIEVEVEARDYVKVVLETKTKRNSVN